MAKTSNHQAIFRASFLTGGAQFIGLAVGLIRNKFVAICLGVSGIGFSAILNQVFGVMQAAATIGIPAAGVRAVALSKDDAPKMGLAVKAVRHSCRFLAVVVASVFILFSPLLSLGIFGDYQHVPDILILVVALVFAQMAAAEQTILRGLGYVGNLAKVNIKASVIGTSVAIPGVYFLGLKGIAPSILAASCALFLLSRRASSRVIIESVECSREDVVNAAWSLGRAGTAFFGLSIIGMLLSLGLTLMVKHHEGIEGNGIYQAAAALTVTIASFVLSAMGQDFYPKIVGLLGKNQKDEVAIYCANQIEMGLLLAMPILAGVSFFSHELIRIAYSADFHPADPLVGVLAVSCWARICYWPHMLCMLAEAKTSKILIPELSFALACAFISWFVLPNWGVAGVACAYAACYLIYSVVVSCIVSRMTGHMPLCEVWKLYLIGAFLIVAGYYCNPVLKILLLMLMGAYVLRKLSTRLGSQHKLTMLIQSIPLLRCLLPVSKS